MVTLDRHIAVEPLRPSSYESVLPPTRMGALASYAFGGNTLAVAVNAAYQIVLPSHHLYSICGHFVRAARTNLKLVCQVENIRDTRTFQTRIIRVHQEGDDGSTQLCIIASADFHIEEPRSMVNYSTLPQTGLPLIGISSSDMSIQTVKEYGLCRNIEHFLEMQPIASAVKRNKETEDRKNLSTAPSRFSAEAFRIRVPLGSEAEQISVLTFYMDKWLA
ncbi:hypothetical protein ETB97_007413 [Aspergillus alliaceus]|uniref:Acyl-CoA thioesterase-like N-terminal HotDog domain-containing protein n=1 Tax=Petromyces alliaceus TaxID=209559 RepID=A0A8H6ACN1_PETAA|nr:hypothetical protein ETB97_007413 [Aspergillus burnettii]